jgi:hypothetical protein
MIFPKRNLITTSRREVGEYIKMHAESSYARAAMWAFFNWLSQRRLDKNYELEMELFSYFEIQNLHSNKVPKLAAERLERLFKRKKKTMYDRVFRWRTVNQMMKKIEIPDSHGLECRATNGVLIAGDKIYNGTSQSLWDIAKFLDVENSPRYKAIIQNEKLSACMDRYYAADFARLCKAYIPLYWWTPPALLKLLSHGVVKPIVGDTLYKMSTNDIVHWFMEYSHFFGWSRVYDTKEAQKLAGKGKFVVMMSYRKYQRGRITVVMNNAGGSPKATEAHIPLQSYAWQKNKKSDRLEWWTSRSMKYSSLAIYVHNA